MCNSFKKKLGGRNTNIYYIKILKKVHTNPSISTKIISIEQTICDCHTNENFMMRPLL